MYSHGTVVVFVLSVLVAGCGASIRSAATEGARMAVPVVIDEKLNLLEDPVVRERIERFLRTPEVQRAIHEAAVSATAGALDEVSSDAESERLAKAASRVTVAVSRALAEVVKEEVLNESSYRDTLSTLEASASDVTTTATRAAIRAAADEIPRSLGPSIGDSMATELESPRFRRVLAGVVEDATKAAILGAQQGIIDVRETKKAAGVPTITDRLVSVLVMASVAAFVFGAGLIVLIVWAIRRRGRRKEYATVMVGALPSRMERKKGKFEWSRFARDSRRSHMPLARTFAH
jgi:hypothetical protein